MSERAAAVGRLTEKLMDLRTFADDYVDGIEDQDYEPLNTSIERISGKMDAYYEDIGGLCEHILTLPEPGGEAEEVDTEDEERL